MPVSNIQQSITTLAPAEDFLALYETHHLCGIWEDPSPMIFNNPNIIDNQQWHMNEIHTLKPIAPKLIAVRQDSISSKLPQPLSVSHSSTPLSKNKRKAFDQIGRECEDLEPVFDVKIQFAST